jgi:hypothetical protein
MARNGSGTYTNPYPDFISGTVISSTQVDANNSDIATALTQSIAVDGQSVVTGDIPLATHKFTAMKVGTAATDSLSLGQAQAEAFVWCGTAGGSADAITLSPSPAITAYAAGQRFVWMASGSTNTGATTVAISGLSTIALQDNGAALSAGQHAAGKMFMGILNTTSTVQIMQVQVSGTDPLIVSSLTVTGDATIGDDLTLLSDASVLGFGEHTDVKITHVHDSGLTLKNTSTADDTPFVLLVQTGETDIALNDALGKIQFQAPDEAAGTDSRLVAAEIAAISEGDFSASNNATKLSFKTGASEAATEKMSLSSVGNVTMKQTQTGDDTPMTLLLQTGETDIAANDVLGKIQFQAPDEGTGTDAVLVAAEVAAISEGDFSASSNATKLSFKTAASEAASEKMSLSSGGNLTVSGTYNGGGTMTTGGNVVIPNAGTIGSASDADSMAISAAGVVTFTQTPVFPTSASASVSVFTSSGTWSKPSNLLYAIIEVQGGGGGGGGTANPGSDEAGAGSGGGSGGYARKVLLASALGSTETVTVGASAAGGSSSDGTAGNASTFAVASGTDVVGNGGTGGKSRGSGIASVATLDGVAGGSATGGDINITGSGSGPAICMGNNAFGTSSTQALAFGSAGGSGFFGGGGGSGGATETTAQNGGDGVSGGGGGGAASGDTGAAATGGAGGAGLVIVTQYLSA